MKFSSALIRSRDDLGFPTATRFPGWTFGFFMHFPDRLLAVMRRYKA